MHQLLLETSKTIFKSEMFLLQISKFAVFTQPILGE